MRRVIWGQRVWDRKAPHSGAGGATLILLGVNAVRSVFSTSDGVLTELLAAHQLRLRAYGVCG